MELRPYQQQAKDAIFSEWKNGIKKTLLVLPTGCGKTIVFAKVAEECVKGGSRVLILAHRGELLDQAADKIGKSTGLGCATEKAEQTCLGSWFRIVVGSVQSMMREKRLNQFPNDYFNTIIIDEAHHCISDSYQKVLRHFPDAEVLGVTATPDRGDMQNLGTVFESLAYEYTLPKAIKEGYLSPIKAVTITGVIKGIYTKKLSSETGFKGLLKKIVMFIVIAVSFSIQELIGNTIPLREVVIMFYICNEALSLLENAAVFVPIPDKLKDVLIQLRDKDTEEDTEGE